MARLEDHHEHLLCIVPPYRHRSCPPAGAAALLGHLVAAGHDEVGFLDLRLAVPDAYMPTFDVVGTFGESFVVDVPDLPLVLRLLRAFDRGEATFEGGPRDEVFDAYCYARGLDPARLLAYLVGMDQFLEDVLRPLDRLRFIGLSVWSSNLTTTLMAAAHLKRRRTPPVIVAGGPQVTESLASARLGLSSGLFDAVIPSEGEGPLLAVYRAVQAGRSLEGLPGVMTRARPEPERSPLLSMPELADPDFTRMDLQAYRSDNGGLRLPFQLSRGCTDKCTFCSEWVFWQRFRPDTPDHAVEQLCRLATTYGVDQFHFTDSLINGHMNRLRSFAEALLVKGLRVDWGGFMRANMDDATARLLRAAGLSYAYIGVESLDDETLALMNKRRTKADNLNAIQSFLDAGVRVSVGVIPGFPGDTRGRFFETAKILRDMERTYPGSFSFNVEPFVVSPRQPLFTRLHEVGLEPHAWDESVLDIAPQYREISERVTCRVEGANQGVERLGQLRLLQLMLGGDREVGVFDHREALADDRLHLYRPPVPFYLALVKHRGRLQGNLLNAEEREGLLELVRSGRRGDPLIGRPEFRAEWDAIRARHVVPGGGRLPVPVRWAPRPADAEQLYLPGHVVARADGEHIFMVHLLSQAYATLPASCDDALRALAFGPCERDTRDDNCDLDLDLLVGLGLLVATAL